MNKGALGTLLLGLLLAGCAGSSGTDGTLNVLMQPTQSNPGASGRLVLTPSGAATDLGFNLSNPSPGLGLRMQPLYLDTFIYPGSCSQPGSAAAYSLPGNNAVTRIGSTLTFTQRAPVSLQRLRQSPHAVFVRTTADNLSLNIYCANIPGL